MKKSFLSLFVFTLFSCQARSQNNMPDSAAIRLIAKAYGDSVVLRWAPSTPAAWQLLNTTGYKILRMGKASVEGNWTVLNERPVLPLSLDAMKKSLDRNNKYAAIAAQALYGKTLYATKQGLAPSVTQGADILNNQFALSLQCADFSAPVARAIGLGWVDRTAARGEAYIYKVVPAQAIRDVAITAYSLIVVNEVDDVKKKPEGLVAIGGDQKAELQWPRSQEENYSGFQVEISGPCTNHHFSLLYPTHRFYPGIRSYRT